MRKPKVRRWHDRRSWDNETTLLMVLLFLVVAFG